MKKIILHKEAFNLLNYFKQPFISLGIRKIQLIIGIFCFIPSMPIIAGIKNNHNGAVAFNTNIYDSRKAPSDYYLQMHGHIKEVGESKNGTSKNLDGVKVSIFDEIQKEVYVCYSNKTGSCNFQLPLDRQFVIKFSKNGWVTKIVDVDTWTSVENAANYKLFFDIDLFKDIPELDVSVLKQPIANIVFNEFLLGFDYNYKHSKEVNEDLKKLYASYYGYHYADSNKNNIKPASTIFAINSNKVEIATTSAPNSIPTVTTNEVLKNIPEKNMNTNVKNFDCENKMVFKVQIISLTGQLPVTAPVFAGCGKVNEYFHNNEYKYTVGEFSTLESADKILNEFRKKGFKDAFIVPFINGSRVTIAEARDFLSFKYLCSTH